MADRQLSVYAKNVKIIANNGKVVLKGPVHSMEEEAAILEKARKVAGASKVVNKLEVKK
jgi:osmotically-inducible protein OsmY